METKEIKINIPEGYEIDKENSTFECIKFKSKKYITYEDCCKKIFPNDEGYYISTYGVIADGKLLESRSDPNNATSEEQLERLLALNRLMNIAYYYNDNEYAKSGYYIYYLNADHKYCTGYYNPNNFRQIAEMTVLFKNDKDAQAVIDNPNFRSILDTLCK